MSLNAPRGVDQADRLRTGRNFLLSSKTVGPSAAQVRFLLGGPFFTIDRTVFELWLGTL